jgi:YHS domain-containing protein
MPPKGKPQPTEAQLSAIEAWIKAGAPMPDSAVSIQGDASHDGTTPNSDPASEEGESTASAAEPASPPKPAGPAPASADAIAAVQASLVHVEPVSVNSTLLIMTFNAIAPNVDDALAEKLLSPIKANVADLSLARTKVTDKIAELLATMPNLRRLDLRGTPITPAAVATLAKSESLRELILAQTKLSDEIVPPIVGMTGLSHVFLWNAGLSTESIAKLRTDRPELEVDAGDRLETQNLGAEEPLKFSSDAPPPGQPLAGTASLEPINKVCPITGNPINPKYLVVYDGKVIGFCCPNCPKEFWADPEKCLAAMKLK